MASNTFEMPDSEATDRELIRQVLAGKQQAFAFLVERYKAMVFTVAFRITGSREDAEELAQSAFVKAYRSLADYRHEAKFSTWLYTIVHHLSLSFLRKQKPLVTSISNNEFEISIPDVAGNGIAMSENRSRQQLLTKAMQLLASDDAAIISMFYQGEQTLDEIACVMGITPNNAKVKLHRARLKLKNVLESHYANEIESIVYK